MWFFKKAIRFTDLPFRTDMHSHILPGVDDGFKDLESSCRALDMLRTMGLEHMILTPHIYPELYPSNDYDFIKARFATVGDQLKASGMQLRIAGEHMVYNGFEEGFNDKTRPHLKLSEISMLIEMSYAFESRTVRETIFSMNSSGISPVLAHPERYTFYSRSLTQLKALENMDCALQLNILSLGGFYGHTAQEKAEAMLEQGMYTYVGTDLHAIPQIDCIKKVEIKKKHLPAVEQLLHNNDLLWNE